MSNLTATFPVADMGGGKESRLTRGDSTAQKTGQFTLYPKGHFCDNREMLRKGFRGKGLQFLGRDAT